MGAEEGCDVDVWVLLDLSKLEIVVVLTLRIQMLSTGHRGQSPRPLIRVEFYILFLRIALHFDLLALLALCRFPLC